MNDWSSTFQSFAEAEPVVHAQEAFRDLCELLMDRLVNNAYKLDLKGHSRRKVKTTNET